MLCSASGAIPPGQKDDDQVGWMGGEHLREKLQADDDQFITSAATPTLGTTQTQTKS